MAELQVPPSIDDSRSRALLTLIGRLDSIDLTPMLVYRIDSVPAGALPFLAWQFDIISPLWQSVAPVILSVDAITDVDAIIDIDTLTEGPSVTTVQQSQVIAAQRSLVKMAIQLHRSRGTPSAIKNALATLGWPEVSIAEGQSSWGASNYPSNQGWAVFRVMIRLQEGQTFDPAAPASAAATINFFKPARAFLDALIFVLPTQTDSAPTPADSVTLGGIATYQVDPAPFPSDATLAFAVTLPPTFDPFGPAAPLYSGQYRHSGITYGANQPGVADSALILNGNPVLQGG